MTHYGLGGLGATLASRFTTVLTGVGVLTNTFYDGQPIYYFVPTNGWFPITWGLPGALPYPAHFPYGMTVDPDAPL